jgi:hypothetical protein
MTQHLNSAGNTLVADAFFWRPIDAHTPLGVKMLVINRDAGVAQISTVQRGEKFYTHTAPLPKFKEQPNVQSTD